MRTLKNWKSELKKKGAMALTAFMLCGSAGTAFAQSPDDVTKITNITIFDKESGDEVSSGQPTPGNVKTVTGYQTELAVGYAANVTWGDMVFVYDRGTYDTSTGILVGSEIKDSEGNARTDIEMGGDTSKAGYWYGFDGDNNSVEIENLSTEMINVLASANADGAKAGSAKLQLYVHDTEGTGITGDITGKWTTEWQESLSKIEKEVHHDPNENDKMSTDSGTADSGSTSESYYYDTNNGPIRRYFKPCTFTDNGEKDASDKAWFYLNVNGKPDSGFEIKKTYDKESENAKIGTVTLTFYVRNSDVDSGILNVTHGNDPTLNP